MKEEPQNSLIGLELEARIVALVLGEASDFERDELNRLIQQRPELAAFEREMQDLHRLMLDAGFGETFPEEDEWKLSEEKRGSVLAVISGEVDGLTIEPTASPLLIQLSEKPNWMKQGLLWNLSKIAAVLCAAGFVGSMLMPSVYLARDAAPRSVASKLVEDSELSDDALSPPSESFKQRGLAVNKYHDAQENSASGLEGTNIDAYGRAHTFMTDGAVAPKDMDEFSTSDSMVLEHEVGKDSKSALSEIRDSLAMDSSRPSPYYLQDDVQYFPSEPKLKLPGEVTSRSTRRLESKKNAANLREIALLPSPAKTPARFGRPDAEWFGKITDDEREATSLPMDGPRGGELTLPEYDFDKSDEQGGVSYFSSPDSVRIAGKTAAEKQSARVSSRPDMIAGMGMDMDMGMDMGIINEEARSSPEFGQGLSRAQSQRSSGMSMPDFIDRPSPSDESNGSDQGRELGNASGQMGGGIGGGGMSGGGKGGGGMGGGGGAFSGGAPNSVPALAEPIAESLWDLAKLDDGAERSNASNKPLNSRLADSKGEGSPSNPNGPRAITGFSGIAGLSRSDLDMKANNNNKSFGVSPPAAAELENLNKTEERFDKPKDFSFHAPLRSRTPKSDATKTTNSGTDSGVAREFSKGRSAVPADRTLERNERQSNVLYGDQPADKELYLRGKINVPDLSDGNSDRVIDELQSGQEKLNGGLADRARTKDALSGIADLNSAFGESLLRDYRTRQQADGEPLIISGKRGKDWQREQSLIEGESKWEGYVPPIEKKLKQQAAPAELSEKSAQDEAFSTFSLHVSDVSFKLAQAALARGEWPEAAKIRIEEFVNAFDYGDPMPSKNEKVACRVEQSIHPFLQQRNLLRVSMRTAAAGRASNTPLRLTFLLDNSGSMERIDRQQTVRRAFALLAQQLKPIDQVTLISFARQPRLLADKVSGDKSRQLVQIIHDLPSEGGTNIEAALQLAFEKAQEQFTADAQNRIILLTDGAVNLGNANPEVLSRRIATMRDAGIAFDAAGISAEGLNDEILEALTRKGDGRYYLLDSIDDADEGFVRQIAGALRPSAKNVKVQIEFNPKRVGRYKLLGFEKHRLKKEDFRNDKVDAAEMAAAEAGVAVYQFEAKPDGEGDIGSVSVRFQDLSTGQMVENRWPIPYESDAPRADQAPASLRIATCAAMLAAKLRGEPLGQSVDLKTLSTLIAGLPDQDRQAKRVQQLQLMIQQARQVSGQ